MKFRNTVTILAMLSLTLAANAAIVQTNVSQEVASEIGSNPYAGEISSSDLVDDSSATLSSEYVSSDPDPSWMGNGSNLNDGVDNLAWVGIASKADGRFVDYTLDTASSPEGYKITQIVLQAGKDNAAGFNAANVKFEIHYQALNSTDWTLLGEFEYAIDEGPAAGNDVFSKVTLTDTTGTVVSGIQAVRFVAYKNGNPGHFRELDVFGAAVPEPATMGLVALGSLGLLRRRRR
jgi:hypothetical protein